MKSKRAFGSLNNLKLNGKIELFVLSYARAAILADPNSYRKTTATEKLTERSVKGWNINN